MLRKNAIDISGKKYGDLTALYPVKSGVIRGVQWLCRCVCGKDAVVFGGHLRSGKRVSCGCRSERYIHETGINRVFSRYKRTAYLRKKQFNLTREDFSGLVLNKCFYCGIEPSQVLKRFKTNKIQLLYNGIDRIDSSKGYIINNCVSCCRYCNQSKSDLSLNHWMDHIKRIVKWQDLTDSI